MSAHASFGASGSAFAACSRPEVANAIQHSYDDLGGAEYLSALPDKLPVVYDDCYNITFFGIEKLHPFDSTKFRKVVGLLERAGVLRRSQLVPPKEASEAALLEVHDAEYLRQLDTSPLKVAYVTQLSPLAFLPAFLLRRKVLRPMKVMAGGTMLAAALAMRHGYALNLGGGMHHAWHADGGGWCAYADIHLAFKRLRAASGGAAKRFMVVDLDVHQGNGVARDKLHFAASARDKLAHSAAAGRSDDGSRGESGSGRSESKIGEGSEGGYELVIVDIYNADIYPQDHVAKRAIDVAEELRSGAGDATYLAAVERALRAGFECCPCPDLVVFNAGTDLLEGDPLGRLRVTPAGVARRDELVWEACRAAGSPVLMLLSGGYTRASVPCIADSLANLARRFGLFGGAPGGQ